MCTCWHARPWGSAPLTSWRPLALAFAVRRQPDAVTRGVVQLASVGYAVPGAVIVVGLLLPVGWLQAAMPQWGVGGMGLLMRVHWPLLKRSTADATLLVFVDVMKELPATIVLRPFDSDTLAVVAYQLARDERLGEAALPSLALVAVGLVPVILLSRTLRGSSR